MSYEFLFSSVVFPFGQAILYDIWKKASSNFQTQKLLRDAINKSVKSAFSNKYNEISTAVSTYIIESCERHEKIDISYIVSTEFRHRGEENLNPTIVATEINNNLSANIMSEPDLIEFFTADIVSNLICEFKTFQKNITRDNTELESGISQLLDASNTTLFLLHEIIRHNQETTNNLKKAEANAKYISDTYKNHFLKPLFLEKSLSDGKVATLKDVYIENKFSILDFPYHNENFIYTGLLKFIINFVNGNLLEENYHTRYSLDSNAIRVLFVKGHPGSGKSSLFYYLANLKCYDERFFPDHTFYFVKLIDVYNFKNGNLSLNNPFGDIEDYLNMPSLKSKTVLVLDGLDEICVANNFDVNEYCNNLIRIVSGKRTLRVIITTRLNYISISNHDNANVINVQLHNLAVEDLKIWIEKYFSIHTSLDLEKEVALRNIEFLKLNNKNKVPEIFAIPLLFYMIVISKADLSKINNVGQLYDAVFEELKERNYNPDEESFRQTHGINRKISDKLARQIAIEISYEMYKANTQLLKINSEQLKNALNEAFEKEWRLREADKEQIEVLFPITFFYKNSYNNSLDGDVVEFAHKSIAEFFSAEKLFQCFVNSDGPLSTFIETYLMNPIVVSNEVLSFFEYFVNSRNRRFEMREKYPNILQELLSNIKNQETIVKNYSYYRPEFTKVFFKLYWFFIRNILECSPQAINKIIKDSSVKDYILGVLSIRNSHSIPLLDEQAINLCFDSLYFSEYSFSYCSLEYCCFNNAAFDNCIFEFANLRGIQLNNLTVKDRVSFNSCNFDRAYISNLKFQKDSKIIFSSCAFNNTIFNNVDFKYFTLESILSFDNVSLTNVTLSLRQYIYLYKSKFTFTYQSLTLNVSRDDFDFIEQGEVDAVPLSKRHQTIMKIISRKTSIHDDIDIIIDYKPKKV